MNLLKAVGHWIKGEYAHYSAIEKLIAFTAESETFTDKVTRSDDGHRLQVNYEGLDKGDARALSHQVNQTLPLMNRLADLRITADESTQEHIRDTLIQMPKNIEYVGIHAEQAHMLSRSLFSNLNLSAYRDTKLYISPYAQPLLKFNPDNYIGPYIEQYNTWDYNCLQTDQGYVYKKTKVPTP